MSDKPSLNWMGLLPVAIFIALIGGFFLPGLLRDDPNTLPSAFIGKPAPSIEAIPLGDHPTFSSEVFADGQVKLVNFWASWCAPCRVEHPNIEALAGEMPVYGVNQKDRPQAALRFLEELGNPYAGVSTDADGRQSVDWGVYGLPETFVVDGQGRVVARIAGALTQRVIADTLRPALEAAAN